MAARKKWTDEQRDEALRIGVHKGWRVASEQTGIPQATINSWARRLGVKTAVLGITTAAVAAHSVAAEERRHDLAEGLKADIGKLRARLFRAESYPHVKVKGLGDGRSAATTVWVDCDMPSPADQLRLMQAIGIATDKVQLLTGQATERMDLTGEYDLEAELRAYQQGLTDRGSVKP